MLASRYSDMPVVNAGDGGATNPTLTDLLSIGRLHDRCSHRPVPEG
jgi:aspartate carbamoyltransferase catalytic subunit